MESNPQAQLLGTEAGMLTKMLGEMPGPVSECLGPSLSLGARFGFPLSYVLDHGHGRPVPGVSHGEPSWPEPSLAAFTRAVKQLGVLISAYLTDISFVI